MQCLIISSEKMMCLIFLFFLQYTVQCLFVSAEKKDSCLVCYFCASCRTLDRLTGFTWTPRHVPSGTTGKPFASSRWFRMLSSMWVLEWQCRPAVQLSEGCQMQLVNLHLAPQGPGSCWHKHGGHKT
jgi:hypothetical protein